jgi:hypothetical protein
MQFQGKTACGAHFGARHGGMMFLTIFGIAAAPISHDR